MASTKTVTIKIRRQLTPDAKLVWDEFDVPNRPGMNVTSAMMEIAAHPVTRDGKKTTPVTYDSNCLEEVCGSCAMLINGKARMACSARQVLPSHQAGAVVEISAGARSLRRSQRSLRKFEEGQSLGTGGRNLRSWSRPTPDCGRTRRVLSPVTLHFVLLLHGGLPAV